jgi:hypothetical protein
LVVNVERQYGSREEEVTRTVIEMETYGELDRQIAGE